MLMMIPNDQNHNKNIQDKQSLSGANNQTAYVDKKFLSSNDKLFMNCFLCTVLPPPNIPIQESVKIRNYSERDRYYRIANELMKLKKIIVNDLPN